MPPITDALVEQDGDGVITEWNAEAERLFGWPRADAVGMRSDRLIPERNRERYRLALRALLAAPEGRVIERDLTAVDRSGREFPVRFSASWSTQSGSTQITAAAFEITPELRAGQAAEGFQDSARYRAMLDQIEDGCCALDLRGNFVFVNDAFCSLFGFVKDEIVGCNFRTTMAAGLADELRERYMQVYRTGVPAKGLQYRVSPPNSSTRFVEQTISLERDADGRPVGFLAITRDCTARKEAELQIARAKEAAENANRAKSDFLANMSHEIRTPMNGIIGMTTLTLDTPLTPDQRDCLVTVKTLAESLLAILNDILDFSKIESRKLTMESIDFTLADVFEPVAKLFGVQAHAKGLAFTIRIADNVPSRLTGDPLRLRQVITNLAANAIKFTERGSVAIEVSLDSLTAATATLRFGVIDTGIGIPEDKQTTIFEAFSQADGSMTRRFGGTGLGLAIASELVRLMNGRIWVDSTPGIGSAFQFTIEAPLAAQTSASHDAGPSEAQTTPPRLSVLIAEDNVVNQRVAAGLLTRRGHEVTVVGNGREALRAVERRAFDLVLMDVQMPEMDGFEATAAIRQFERTADRRVRVVAMTAHAMSGDRDRCLAAGMDGYIAKPIDPQRLFEVVEERSVARK